MKVAVQKIQALFMTCHRDGEARASC